MKRVEQVRREHDATGRIGFMRYRLTLINDDLLELTGRVEVWAGEIVVTKYRHHWQSQEGVLIKRWDNAPHYPQVASFPHHLHDGDIRVIDESGEDYLYPASFFVVIEVPQAVERAILHTS